MVVNAFLGGVSCFVKPSIIAIVIVNAMVSHGQYNINFKVPLAG